MNEPWKIKSRSSVCAETGREFTEGEHFYTALFENPEDEGFERKDFSEDAWEKVGEFLKPFSFWRTKFEAPPPVPEKDVVEKQTAESLLRRLIEEDLPATENARYILAVMLERKKILIQTDTKPIKRGSLLIYERHKTGEAFIVNDPQLKLEEIESVQEEVSALLGGGKKEENEDKEPREETVAVEAVEAEKEETPQEVS